MLVLRLARIGRTKRAFFRIVLTEHTKPVKAGYKEVLGRYNPIDHTMEVDLPKTKEWISKGATPSERLAKIIVAHTKDESFKKFITHRERKAPSKNEDK